MDREIVFRGKRTDTGEWAEGDIVKHSENVWSIWWNDGIAFGNCPVDPGTIGQFTGLKDKNGKRIFEGDIVDRHGSGMSLGGQYVVVSFESGGFFPFAIPGWECTAEADECEIIGNVYDNPDLDRKEEDDA